jgi:hypothetical protein
MLVLVLIVVTRLAVAIINAWDYQVYYQNKKAITR